MVIRDFKIDNAKGIGILLVVFGHCLWVSEDILTLIYSFHMPLFFMISGFLSINSLTTYKKILSRLFLPFIFFYLVSYLSWLPLNLFGNGDASQVDWYLPLKELLLLQRDKLQINGVLWFFPALIVVSVVDCCFKDKRYDWLGVAIFLLLTLIISIYDLDEVSLYWCLDVSVVSGLYFFIGRVIKRKNVLDASIFMGSSKYTLLIVASLFFIFLSMLNSKVDIRSLIFGEHLSLFLINALLGSLITYLISCIIGNSKTLQFLSIASITIFPLHLIVLRFLHAFEKVFFRNSSFEFFLPLINTLVAILICSVIHVFLNKYFGFLLGRGYGKRVTK